MGDQPHDEDFDGYVVDTRRQARWTESRRPGAEPEARRSGPEAQARRPAVAAPGPRTRAGESDPVRPTPRTTEPHQRPTSGSTRPASARSDAPVLEAGASAPRPRGPRRSWGLGDRRLPWKRLLAALVVAWIAFLVLTPLHAWTQVHTASTAPVGERPTTSGGHNYLLLGSDSRVGLSDEERARLGASVADGQRTDSIILVHVPEHGGKSALVSIPRDSFVPVPGHSSHKINAAYSIGGSRLMQQTVEQVGNIRIDGVLEIGFAGFSDIVDSLGGVTLCPKWAMKDPEAALDVKPGCQTMDGPTALGYVRTRHTDPRGDLGRADRQREFLGAVMKQAASPATVLLPWRYWSFTHAATGSVQLSDTLGPGDALAILQAMRGTGSGDSLSLTMPISSINYPTPADGSAVKWNTEQARHLFQMIHDDTPMDSPPPGTSP